MEAPKLKYNQELYDYFRSVKKNDKSYMLCNLDILGQGATGTTYTANVKPSSKYPDLVVLKEQKRNRYCLNEIEALRYLREQMLEGKLPGYYVFMYTSFASGNKKYLVLEKADQDLDDYLTNTNRSSEVLLRIFWYLADAVDHLEQLQFNHGDLWSENVMLSWDGEGNDDEDKPKIKLIDYDSAFKAGGAITNPSYGGADNFRKRFILGYDLNRFFDGLIYSYDSFIKKKRDHKRKKINKLKKLRRKGKKVTIPRMDEPDSSDDEFDEVNIIYPAGIVDFIHSLKPRDPNDFNDNPELSGAVVKKKIEALAVKLTIEL